MYNDLGILFARLSFGITMALSHGLPKLLNFSNLKNSFPDPIGLGNSTSLILVIFSEFFCSLLVALGLKTRISSLFLIVTMITAAFVIHAGEPWKKVEFPLVYSFGFIFIFITGGGKISLDDKLR